MRAYLSLKMDRPIDLDAHYISPGGYHVIAGEKEYGFDFNLSFGNIDDDDPTVIHFELRDADTDTFPEIGEMRKHLHEVNKFDECYVYTGEQGEPEIHPVKILEFIIEDSGEGKRECPPDSEFVTCNMVTDDDGYIITYTFTEKLLGTVEDFPGC